MMKLCSDGEQLFQNWVNTVNDDRQTSEDNYQARIAYQQHKKFCAECQSLMKEHYQREYHYVCKSKSLLYRNMVRDFLAGDFS